MEKRELKERTARKDQRDNKGNKDPMAAMAPPAHKERKDLEEKSARWETKANKDRKAPTEETARTARKETSAKRERLDLAVSATAITEREFYLLCPAASSIPNPFSASSLFNLTVTVILLASSTRTTAVNLDLVPLAEIADNLLTSPLAPPQQATRIISTSDY